MRIPWTWFFQPSPYPSFQAPSCQVLCHHCVLPRDINFRTFSPRLEQRQTTGSLTKTNALSSHMVNHRTCAPSFSIFILLEIFLSFFYVILWFSLLNKQNLDLNIDVIKGNVHDLWYSSSYWWRNNSIFQVKAYQYLKWFYYILKVPLGVWQLNKTQFWSIVM